MKINQKDGEKVAFGIAGLVGGTMAMKAVEKAIASQTVSGLLGLDGVATLKEIAPPLVIGVLGTGYFANNRGKNAGYAGLGAAMAAGAKVVEKVSNKTIFAGLGASEPVMMINEDYPAIEGDSAYYYDEPDQIEGYSLEDDEVQGIEVEDIL